MKWALTITFFLFLNLSQAQNKIDFSIVVGGKDVGDFYVTKSVSGDTTVYSGVSKTQVSLAKMFAIDYTVNVIHIGGELWRSTMRNIVNNDTRDAIEVKRDRDVFKVFEEGELERTINIKPDITSLEMYYSEPKGVSRTLSEVQGLVKNVTQVKENVYKVEGESSYESYFHYKNGALQKVVVHYSLAKFEIRRD
ncbi:DUF6134 family protein [Salibacter halophilus]|uniref:DUF3108 domain-containing protein n=1 Tax=Salibacter halophilus TaxID=1803916 RepID=A0A6N6M9Z2_9FLAO|nr:DUF6134 family protein [Salibacter halophilus]KAB1065530.1 hypothetical protein F3059_02440 [Salibacter halophilus]